MNKNINKKAIALVAGTMITAGGMGVQASALENNTAQVPENIASKSALSSVDKSLQSRCNQPTVYVTASTGLNFRSTPKVTNSNKLGALPYGTPVVKIGHEKGWDKIVVNSGKSNEKIGYASAQYLSEKKPQGNTNVSQNSKAGTVTATSLNFRSAPGTTSYCRVIGSLKAGDKFELTKLSPRVVGNKVWREVKVTQAKNSSLVGRKGWIAIEYTTLADNTQKPEAKPEVSKPVETPVAKPETSKPVETPAARPESNPEVRPEVSKPENTQNAKASAGDIKIASYSPIYDAPAYAAEKNIIGYVNAGDTVEGGENAGYDVNGNQWISIKMEDTKDYTGYVSTACFAKEESKPEHSKEVCGPFSDVDQAHTGNQMFIERKVTQDLIGKKKNCEHAINSDTYIIPAGTIIKEYYILSANNKTMVGYEVALEDGTTDQVLLVVDNIALDTKTIEL